MDEHASGFTAPASAGLGHALNEAGLEIIDVTPMADAGLAHEHFWLHRASGSDWVARLPKQSQMNLAPKANLDYQACCFRRASQGGHTPALQAILPPGDALPRGGLIVTAISGRATRLPDDLPAIARALASLHALDVPTEPQRPPLHAPQSPWQALIDEIETQAQYLDQAGLEPAMTRRITAEIERLRLAVASRAHDEPVLISFDAHPGNFLIDAQDKAILVDLEKCRYGIAGMDLAHASLYTSTTWDVASHAVLDIDAIRGFYAHWAEAMANAGRHTRIEESALLEARRGMWLWSLTWCAKWRALHGQSQDAQARGEDWSGSLSSDSLIAHVADRVDHYLSAAIIDHVLDEWAQLASRPLCSER